LAQIIEESGNLSKYRTRNSEPHTSFGKFTIRKLGGPNVNDPTRSYTVTLPHIWITLIGDPKYVKLVRQPDTNKILIEGVNN